MAHSLVLNISVPHYFWGHDVLPTVANPQRCKEVQLHLPLPEKALEMPEVAHLLVPIRCLTICLKEAFLSFLRCTQVVHVFKSWPKRRHFDPEPNKKIKNKHAYSWDKLYHPLSFTVVQMKLGIGILDWEVFRFSVATLLWALLLHCLFHCVSYLKGTTWFNRIGLLLELLMII